MSSAVERARLAKQISDDLRVIGLTLHQAKAFLEANGLQYRVVRIDGEECMITSDCKSDRIGLVLTMGLVTDTRIG